MKQKPNRIRRLADGDKCVFKNEHFHLLNTCFCFSFILRANPVLLIFSFSLICRAVFGGVVGRGGGGLEPIPAVMDLQ